MITNDAAQPRQPRLFQQFAASACQKIKDETSPPLISAPRDVTRGPETAAANTRASSLTVYRVGSICFSLWLPPTIDSSETAAAAERERRRRAKRRPATGVQKVTVRHGDNRDVSSSGASLLLDTSPWEWTLVQLMLSFLLAGRSLKKYVWVPLVAGNQITKPNDIQQQLKCHLKKKQNQKNLDVLCRVNIFLWTLYCIDTDTLYTCEELSFNGWGWYAGGASGRRRVVFFFFFPSLFFFKKNDNFKVIHEELQNKKKDEIKEQYKSL